MGRGQPPLLFEQWYDFLQLLRVRDGLCGFALEWSKAKLVLVSKTTLLRTVRNPRRRAKQLSIVLREGVFCANELRLKRLDKIKNLLSEREMPLLASEQEHQ